MPSNRIGQIDIIRSLTIGDTSVKTQVGQIIGMLAPSCCQYCHNLEKKVLRAPMIYTGRIARKIASRQTHRRAGEQAGRGRWQFVRNDWQDQSSVLRAVGEKPVR